MHAQDKPALRVTADADGTTTVLRLAGELDLATAPILREEIAQLLSEESSGDRLVVDVAALEFLDVTGLAALLDARRRVLSLGGSIALRRPRPMVLRMLGLLELEDELAVED